MINRRRSSSAPRTSLVAHRTLDFRSGVRIEHRHFASSGDRGAQGCARPPAARVSSSRLATTSFHEAPLNARRPRRGRLERTKSRSAQQERFVVVRQRRMTGERVGSRGLNLRYAGPRPPRRSQRRYSRAGGGLRKSLRSCKSSAAPSWASASSAVSGSLRARNLAAAWRCSRGRVNTIPFGTGISDSSMDVA